MQFTVKHAPHRHHPDESCENAVSEMQLHYKKANSTISQSQLCSYKDKTQRTGKINFTYTSSVLN